MTGYTTEDTKKDSITVQGYAKVNLGLDVVGRLPNGYHEVKMVMQTVGVHDTICLKKIPEGIVFTTENGEIPGDDTNLACRAARLFLESTGIRGGVSIELEKRIPVAAGLAGGSTDAAAVLKGLAALYGAKLTTEELMELGVKIGADVPYCIMGGTALAEGIGEKLTALPDVPPAAVLLAKPDLFVSTKEVYGRLQLSDATVHPDIDGMVQAIRDGKLSGVTDRMGNVLQDVTAPAYPVIGRLIELMEENGAVKAMMSGSGPTVFGLFASREEAAACGKKLEQEQAEVQWQEKGYQPVKQIFVTEFVSA